jgi:uncharacterized RDD family membrane protein YckC
VPEEETDAFGRPLRPESTDPFGAPLEDQREPVAPPGWAPPVAPSTEPVAEWQPPAGGAPSVAGEPASWWSRVGATILDGLVVAVIAIVLGVGIAGVALDADDEALEALAAVAGLIVAALYYGLLMRRGGERNGQTWGKQAVGIRVVRTDGKQMTFGYALLRELLVKTVLFGYVAVFTLYLATLLNYLWPLWDPRNRALHDRVARTLVRRV